MHRTAKQEREKQALRTSWLPPNLVKKLDRMRHLAKIERSLFHQDIAMQCLETMQSASKQQGALAGFFNPCKAQLTNRPGARDELIRFVFLNSLAPTPCSEQSRRLALRTLHKPLTERGAAHCRGYSLPLGFPLPDRRRTQSGSECRRRFEHS